MQLGEIIRSFGEEAPAGEALLAGNDIVLFARVGEAAVRYEETVGEYAAGAVPAVRQSGCQRGLVGPDERRRARGRSGNGLPDLYGQLVAEAGRDTCGPGPRRLHVRRGRRLLVNIEPDQETVMEELRGLARVGILVISDRASRGEYNDKSGKAINEFLNSDDAVELDRRHENRP